MSIFYLNRDIQELIEQLDDEDLSADLYDMYMRNLIDKTEKLNEGHVNLFKASMEYDARIDARKREIAKMAAFNNQDMARSNKIKEVVKDFMVKEGLKEISHDDTRVKLGRISESVSVKDGTDLAEVVEKEFIREKTMLSVDKKLVKGALKDGKRIDWAYIIQNRSIKAS